MQVLAWHKDYYLAGVEFNDHLPTDDVVLKLATGEPVQIELQGPESGELDGTATVNYVHLNDSPGGSFHLPREVRDTIAVKLSRKFSIPAIRPGRGYSLEANDVSHGEQMILTGKTPPNPWSMELQPVGTIEGRIEIPERSEFDPTKIGIRIATSQDWQHGGDHHYGNASAQPDQQGRFRLPKIASGSMRIFITEPDNAIYRCVPPKNEFVAAGETTSLTIPMQKAVRIKRKFVNTEGEPVPNVQMNLSVPNGINDIMTRSDESGTVTASILPGIRYRQMLVPPSPYGPITNADIPEPDRTILMPVDGPESVTLEPILLTRARAITGRLVGVENPESIRVAIGWTDPAERRRFTTGRYANFPDIGFAVENVNRYVAVNKRGEFRYDRLSPTATAELTPLRDGVRLAETTKIAPEDDPDVEIPLRNFQFVSLDGRVLDENGKPYAGLALRTVVLPAGKKTAVLGPAVKTDSEGRFETPATLPLSYKYQLMALGEKAKPIVRSEWFSPFNVGKTNFPDLTVPRQPAHIPKPVVTQRSPSVATPNPAVRCLCIAIDEPNCRFRGAGPFKPKYPYGTKRKRQVVKQKRMARLALARCQERSRGCSLTPTAIATMVATSNSEVCRRRSRSIGGTKITRTKSDLDGSRHPAKSRGWQGRRWCRLSAGCWHRIPRNGTSENS